MKIKSIIALTAFTLVLLLTPYNKADAGKLKNNVGCGAGTLLLQAEGHNEEGFLTQGLAYTTNAWFFSQPLGITTGTLGCEQPRGIVSVKTIYFVDSNMGNLALDIAMGEGETVNALAVLMEVPEDQHTLFISTLQENFSSIYTHAEIEATEIVTNIHNILG